MRRTKWLPLLASAVLLLAGCPKGNTDYSEGRKAENLQGYDTALVHFGYPATDPTNAEYKLRAMHVRYEASQFHLEQGNRARKRAIYSLR